MTYHVVNDSSPSSKGLVPIYLRLSRIGARSGYHSVKATDKSALGLEISLGDTEVLVLVD